MFEINGEQSWPQRFVIYLDVGDASEAIMQGDAHEQGTSIVRGVVTDHDDAHHDDTDRRTTTGNTADHDTDSWSEPKTGGYATENGSPGARRIRAIPMDNSRPGPLRRNGPVVMLIALAVCIGLLWRSGSTADAAAADDRGALHAGVGELQSRSMDTASRIAALEASDSAFEDRLAALDESIATLTDQLKTLNGRLAKAETQIAAGSTALDPFVPQTPPKAHDENQSDSTAAPKETSPPPGPVLVNTFRNIEIRLLEARHEGTTVAMDFVVTASETDTTLRIDNNGARLNFADGTRHTKYESIATNDWRRRYLTRFGLVAGVPRRFTVEWTDVRTDLPEIAVVELTGDLRHSGTAYAMKFTKVPLE